MANRHVCAALLACLALLTMAPTVKGGGARTGMGAPLGVGADRGAAASSRRRPSRPLHSSRPSPAHAHRLRGVCIALSAWRTRLQPGWWLCSRRLPCRSHAGRPHDPALHPGPSASLLPPHACRRPPASPSRATAPGSGCPGPCPSPPTAPATCGLCTRRRTRPPPPPSRWRPARSACSAPPAACSRPLAPLAPALASCRTLEASPPAARGASTWRVSARRGCGAGGGWLGGLCRLAAAPHALCRLARPHALCTPAPPPRHPFCSCRLQERTRVGEEPRPAGQLATAPALEPTAQCSQLPSPNWQQLPAAPLLHATRCRPLAPVTSSCK